MASISLSEQTTEPFGGSNIIDTNSTDDIIASGTEIKTFIVNNDTSDLEIAGASSVANEAIDDSALAFIESRAQHVSESEQVIIIGAEKEDERGFQLGQHLANLDSEDGGKMEEREGEELEEKEKKDEKQMEEEIAMHLSKVMIINIKHQIKQKPSYR